MGGLAACSKPSNTTGGTMRKLSAISSCGAMALALSLGSGCPAHAQDWKVTGEFEYYGVGKVYQIEKGHIFWVGDFGGTFVNDKGKGNLFDHAGVKCPGANDIDSNNKKQRAMGYCIISDTGGQAYLSWQCEGNADGTPCRGTFEYTGGTEKYQTISGKNSFESHTTAQWPDGTVSGYATWNR
jgi:hypothetical protein